MKINKKATDKQWFRFGGEDSKVEFEIRPCAFSALKLGETGVDLLEQFMFSLCDWKGLLNEDDKPFKYNDTNKLYLYDYYNDVRELVFLKATEMREKLDKELKN